MKATLIKQNKKIRFWNHPVDHFREEYAVIVNKKVPIILRIYRGAHETYVCLQVDDGKGKKIRTIGEASADGYRDDSSAAHDAIEDAGFILSESIKGYGNDKEAIKEALLAIATECGFKNCFVHIAHS